MKFGAFVPQGWRLDLVDVAVVDQWPTILDVATRAEAAGFDSVWVYDHFHTVPVPTTEPTYEAWTLMAALAAATKRIRLGQMCTCNSYRPPAYLAKIAASIDVVSGGRLEVGMGAGWHEEEYLAYGYEFPSAATRIAGLGEAVRLIKRLWQDDSVDFTGEHYRLRSAICSPKPLQRPHPPLWIGGEGERLTLRIVAAEADYANFLAHPDTFSRKRTVLERHCNDVGRDPAEIGLSTNFNVLCAPTEMAVGTELENLERRYGRFAPPEVAAERAGRVRAMAGTPDHLADRIGTWVEAGLDYAIVYFPDAAYGDSLDRFASEVMPHFV